MTLPAAARFVTGPPSNAAKLKNVDAGHKAGHDAGIVAIIVR
jgi:hypothetical protein